MGEREVPAEANRKATRGVTAGALLAKARARLAAADLDPSIREAALLLSHLLGRPEAELYAFAERSVPRETAARFEQLIERRVTGEPVAYLTGEREFWGRPFLVDSRVLIPRPETEHLIEAALALDLPERARILDLGTGSGAIAITLALDLPTASVTAVDLSIGALAVAATNCKRHSIGDRVGLLCGNLATALRISPFDLVVSNPPYIAESVLPTLAPDVAENEPRLALTASDEGTGVLQRLAAELSALAPNTPLLVEIGHDQEGPARELFERNFEVKSIVPDYAGHPRVVVARRR